MGSPGARTPPRGSGASEPSQCSLKTLHDLLRLAADCETESLSAIVQTLNIAIYKHRSQAVVNTQQASPTRCATPSNPLAQANAPQVRSTVRHKQTSTTTARADAVTPPAGLLPPSASSPKPTPFSVRALEFKTELTPTPVASLPDDIAAETRDFIPADVCGYNRTGFTFREGLQGPGYYHDHVGTPAPAVQDESTTQGAHLPARPSRDITNLNGSTLTADDISVADSESEHSESEQAGLNAWSSGRQTGYTHFNNKNTSYPRFFALGPN